MSETRTIDLNADLGEGYPYDEQLMQIVTSANICSGAYISSEEPVKNALDLAAKYGVTVGIHVGYRDVEGFGRTADFMTPEAFDDSLLTQVNSFLVLAKAAGVKVSYLKPHGALYHDLIPESPLWKVLLDVCVWHHWPVVHLAGSDFLNAAAKAYGAVHEGFVDRRYANASGLVPRSIIGAVLTDADEVLAQAQALALGQVQTLDRSLVSINAQSLCLHGDTKGALSLGKTVRSGLESAGVKILPFI